MVMKLEWKRGNVSKESKIKKQLERSKQQKAAPELKNARPALTTEQKAQIIRDRIANRPVIVFRYANGKYNKRFIYTLALMIVALAAALIFLTR
jgi:hypothetical protein